MEGIVDSMKDMLERAAWTFAQSFLAIFAIDNLSTLRVAAIAGVAAALSVVKTYAMGKIA
jgi:hypothetical protein